MNEPTDIKALDEYLKGGSDVSRRYRESSGDDVPPELDRRVLAEARAAVAGGGAARSRSWMRWSAPVALAASLVLVVTVVIESGVQNDASFAQKSPAAESKSEAPAVASANAPSVEDSREARSDKSSESHSENSLRRDSAQEHLFVPEPPVDTSLQSARTQAPAAPPPAAAPSLAKVEAAKKQAANAAMEEVRVQAKVPQTEMASSPVTTLQMAPADAYAIDQPAPVMQEPVQATAARESVARAEAEADTDSAAQISEVAVTGGRARRAPGRTAGPRNTISSPALRGEVGQAADASEAAEQQDPKKWLEGIRELRRAGKAIEADREWLRFLKAYPDFAVAADDLARKQP